MQFSFLLVFARTFARFVLSRERSVLTIPKCPFMHAKCIACTPSAAPTVTSAPKSSNLSTIAFSFAQDAKCIAVRPCMSRSLMMWLLLLFLVGEECDASSLESDSRSPSLAAACNGGTIGFFFIDIAPSSSSSRDGGFSSRFGGFSLSSSSSSSSSRESIALPNFLCETFLLFSVPTRYENIFHNARTSSLQPPLN